MTLDFNWLTLLSGTLLPMLVALVTSRVASGALKSILLAFLSAVAGVVNEAIQVGGDLSALDAHATLTQSLTTFLIAVGLHFGLLKPAGVTGSSGSIQHAVAGGLGAYRGRHRRED